MICRKKTWSLLQKETTGNWTSWYPEDKGSYWLLAEVIDSNGEVHTSVTAAYYEGIKLALNGICTIENTDHVDAGVAYNTNDANVQFQWKLYDLAEKNGVILLAGPREIGCLGILRKQEIIGCTCKQELAQVK